MKRFFVIIFSLLGMACSTKTSKKLVIATAANVQFAMDQLSNSFENETGVECEIILGSSGQLNAQIKAGAPFDVFVSANMKYPQDLFDSNYTTTKPVIYAYGILVLCSNSPIPITLEKLSSDSIRKIAVANPSTAPYGEAALQTLKSIGSLDELSSKLIYGESVSQVNQFIISNATEAGFTSKSVVISDEFKKINNWIEIDKGLYSPIEQGVVVLKGAHEKEAQQFFEFLISKKGKQILETSGYNIN